MNSSITQQANKIYSTPKKEKAYSEKKLKNGVWYHIGIVSIPEAEMNELILYFNGNPDSSVISDYANFLKVIYTNLDPLLNTDLQFGKFKAVGSFGGCYL